MIWGFAGVWPSEFGIWQSEDRLMAQLEFVVKHGFKSTGVPLSEMKAPARRDQLSEFVAQHHLQLTVGVHQPWFTGDPDDTLRGIDEFLADLEAYGELLGVPLVTTAGGGFHRFMEEPCLEEQMDCLTRFLTPLAEGCWQMGRPLAIENHGDYYCSDLAELCRRVPHLHIFLDTGNTYLIGEKPLPAAREAAPYTLGTHFKDHLVNPCLSPLRFEIGGATLGEGHVGLRDIYHILLEESPNPEGLVMQWELVPPKDVNAFDSLERSWQFIRSLPSASS